MFNYCFCSKRSVIFSAFFFWHSCATPWAGQPFFGPRPPEDSNNSRRWFYQQHSLHKTDIYRGMCSWFHSRNGNGFRLSLFHNRHVEQHVCQVLAGFFILRLLDASALNHSLTHSWIFRSSCWSQPLLHALPFSTWQWKLTNITREYQNDL